MESVALAGQTYVLGIDLGSASVGWSAISLNKAGDPVSLLNAGVRIFEPAVTGDIEKGQDESNAVARRAARLARRQFRRRAYRQAQLFEYLQQQHLLPAYGGPVSDGSTQRHTLLNHFDRELSRKWAATDEQTAHQLPLYLMRKAALDQPLTPHELGRAFYHLSQRRGYASNRKAQGDTSKKAGKEEQDSGVVEAGIKTLVEHMRQTNARTLGEYFASLDPSVEKVRRRWTSRQMFKDEFAAIFRKQKEYHPELLTPAVEHTVWHLLFDQRPIRSQAHLIGPCELERGERRAPWATLEAQQFRVLQRVNDLQIIAPGDTNGTALDREQRLKVLELLEQSPEVKFEKLRKTLGLPDNTGFNLQRGGETRLKGNTTNARMHKAFGSRWPAMSAEEKKQLVEDWRTIPQQDSLKRRLMDHWGLAAEEAGALAQQTPPPGYCAFSRKALRKLLPLMEQGMPFKEAEKQIYGTRFSGGIALDRLPPVRSALRTLRNPAVERALTELRKVVNALVREHGKPAEIRIELARDLKKPRKERAEAVKTNRDRQKQRDAAKAKLLRELGPAFEHPSREDVDKALLHEECGGICPYTGRSIEFSSLFGQDPPFDIEHIIPFSRIPDDSFQNKTLCAHEENRLVKRNQTPFEAYRDPEQYRAILDRVRRWPKPNPGKLRRFELRTLEELEGFSARQLNDTRYASKLACELLGTLYGGRDIQTDSGIRQVIFPSSGSVTAFLRRRWGLEAILREAAPSANGQNKGKPRTDHRHHAVDAIVIALSRPGLIAALNRNNSLDDRWPQDSRRVTRLQWPWGDFVNSIRPHIEQMLVSHRPEHRLTGALHDETNYGRPRQEDGKDIVHIRRTVAGLSAGDIENIVDPTIRDAIRAKAAEHAGDLKQWTPNEEARDWPVLMTKTGKQIPIKRVRVKKALAVQKIASGPRVRNVALASNHHAAVFAKLDANGKEKRWESIVVSLFEAADRKRKGLPVVETAYPDTPEYVFKFSLMGGDTILLHKECDHARDVCKPSIWRVRTLGSNGQISLARIEDARLIKDIKAAQQWWSPKVNALRELHAVKVSVDSLGRLHNAGG